jgi:hypothetical protein
LRAVRMSLDMHFPPKALLRRSGNRAQKKHQLNKRERSAMPDPIQTLSTAGCGLARFQQILK